MYQLTDSVLRQAVNELGKRDPLLAGIHAQFGMPPLWSRPQSFDTLVHIVMEQKISLASAQAVMQRVRALCPKMQATQFVHIDETVLRTAGMSARKIAYCHSIAQSLISKELSLQRLRTLNDAEVMSALTQVRGIGPWTAGVYLMMALRRPDAWASGDRALAVSYAQCAGLADIPSYAALDNVASAWIPHRGTAARLLWHAYLEKRRRAV